MHALLQADHIAVGDHVVDDLGGDMNISLSVESDWSKTVRSNNLRFLHDATKKEIRMRWRRGREEEEENKTIYFGKLDARRMFWDGCVFDLGRHDCCLGGKEQSTSSILV